jgi:glycosyltransferase involved in cell wall biosynthesis
MVIKVVHIITGLNDGGAEAVLFRLCVAERSATHIVISLMNEGKYGKLLKEHSVTVYCLNMLRGKIDFSALLQLKRLLTYINPDVVQTWMYHSDILGGSIARLCGIKNIFWGVHHSNLDPSTSKRTTIFVAKVCAHISSVVPKGIVCCSERGATIHKDLGYNSEKINVIPNGYNTAEFSPDIPAGEKLRRELTIDTDFPLIGMVARFDAQKDHQNLLLALSHLKAKYHKFHCLLVGTGVEQGNSVLVQSLATLGLEDCVTLLGRRNDIPRVMNAIDLHVLSSSHGEAFPNVLAEAMACKTPCVTTDVGDASLIVGDTGWVVPPKDSDKLARAMIEAFDYMDCDNKWQHRREDARRRIVENFSIEQMVKSYRAFWGI